MKNAVSKSFKVAITISITFKDFDFVVTAFSEAVSIRKIKTVKNILSTANELRNTGLLCQ